MIKNIITITSLLAAGTLAANAAIVLTLPDSNDSPSQTSNSWSGNNGVANVFNKVKNYGAGYYVGSNGGAIDGSSWGTNGEGDWTNTDNVGTLTLLGRSGAAGLSAALVLDLSDLVGTTIESFSFSMSGTATSQLSSMVSFGLRLVDSSGNTVAGTSDATGSVNSRATDISLVEMVISGGVEIKEGYKLIAGIGGFSGTAASSYTLSNISISALSAAVPEPSSFGLLAGLGALALVGARRRR